VGGRLCLDFVNTAGGRVSRGARSRDYADRVIRDKITAYENLLAWGVRAGTVDRRRAAGLARVAAHQPQAAATVLDRAFGLREALYRIFKSAVESWPPRKADADGLRGELTIAREHQRLAARGGGFVWIFAEQPDALDCILWPVALSAAELLTSPDLGRLGQCAGPNCGWLFLDTSRNHRRQWCDMQDCGNRAKVRRFRARRPRD
jgi:predicted RNA-binding Zn ribbon-like protein